MGRRASGIIISVLFIVSVLSVVLFAAEVKVPASDATKTAPARHTPTKANFGMISGTLLSIDKADPANIKLQVKNDVDGSTRIVSVTPWTNITKVTDISELKTGEQIRIMTRKVEDKDVAMGVMFGKIKNIQVPHAPKAPMAPQVPAVKK